MNNAAWWKTLGWPVYVAAGLLVLILAFFLLEFLSFDASALEGEGTLTPETYMDVVEPLLANANPENGADLMAEYQCVVCHVEGARSNLAPLLDGLAERAGERRPPLTAEAYIYESIVHPTVYVVEGYPEIMPQNYDERLTDEQLGDLIAYLLTL